MAQPYGTELPNNRSRLAKNPEKDKLMNAINKKNEWIAKDFGDMDQSMHMQLSVCSKQLTNLPTKFSVHMKNLTRLDLSKNKLTNLPYTLRLITKLESLLLNHNCMRDVPLVVMELSYLRVLQLSANCIETLPPTLGNILCLETLILSSNKLQELPVSLKNLKQLKTFNVSNNCLKKMPSCLGDLVSLETVILSSNKLEDLPESFNRLNQLKTLDLSFNYFKEFPVCILKGMRSLESLNVSYNKFINVTTAPASEKLKQLYIRDIGQHSKFPLWLFSGCAPRLEVLDLEGTKFRNFNIPDNCPDLSIKILSLKRCSFYDSFVNELMAHTNQLECLRIGNGWMGGSGNAFWAMPIKNLKNPEFVTEIDLRATGLPVVCTAIAQFVNLVRLDIGQNNINWLCKEICSLKKLEVLLVDNNGLTKFPDDIGLLTALKELKANDNNLAHLPESSRHLKDLAYLDLYNNEFIVRPIDVEYMDSLVGLDLDQNNLTIFDSDFIRGTPYETLRKAFRNRYWNGQHHRCTGPRYEKDTEEPTDMSSNTSSISCPEGETNVDVNSNSSEHIEEDWDNSADEFEPGREVNQSSFGHWSDIERAMAMGIYSNRFCPADLHIEPFRNRVAHTYAQGKNESAAEEGQFEDA